jgi:hypothetical protein
VRTVHGMCKQSVSEGSQVAWPHWVVPAASKPYTSCAFRSPGEAKPYWVNSAAQARGWFGELGHRRELQKCQEFNACGPVFCKQTLQSLPCGTCGLATSGTAASKLQQTAASKLQTGVSALPNDQSLVRCCKRTASTALHVAWQGH